MGKRWTVYSDVRDRGIRVSDGWKVDYPVQWPNGRIAYDRPEAVPLYAKREVTRAFNWAQKLKSIIFALRRIPA